jgi:hypothetical protein
MPGGAKFLNTGLVDSGKRGKIKDGSIVFLCAEYRFTVGAHNYHENHF